MLHVELRQFPHTARAFNLTEQDVRTRFVAPWLGKQIIELDGQRFAPERAKLKIFEGPELQTSDLGMGRGWQNATKSGRDVTDRELAAGRADGGPQTATDARGTVGALKDELLALAEVGTVTAAQALALSSGPNPRARVSERLSVAELAVWELLQEGKLRMVREGETVGAEGWEGVLLSPSTWLGSPAPVVLARQRSD